MFEMSTGCFLHVWSVSRNDSIAALIWSLRKVSPDRLLSVLRLRIVCNVGTSRALHQYVIIIFFPKVCMCTVSRLVNLLNRDRQTEFYQHFRYCSCGNNERPKCSDALQLGRIPWSGIALAMHHRLSDAWPTKLRAQQSKKGR